MAPVPSSAHSDLSVGKEAPNPPQGSGDLTPKHLRKWVSVKEREAHSAPVPPDYDPVSEPLTVEGSREPTDVFPSILLR